MADVQRQPIWWRPERGSRGPSRSLDRDAIAATAVTLADADGLVAVSMRALAARLDTSASALYRYVDERADLLDLMADRVVAELRPYPAPGGPWLDDLVGLAARQRDLHVRHPWLVELGYRSSSIGPESLAWFDACLGVLSPVDAPITAKFEVIGLLTGLTGLFARQTLRVRSGAATTFPAVDLTPFPHLAQAFARPGAPPTDDLFTRAVRTLLIGLLDSDTSAS